MSTRNPLRIESTGMVCPVGLNVPAATAAMRAHLKRFIDIPFHDRAFQPVIGAPVPILGDSVQGVRRLIRFASWAAREAFSGLSRRETLQIPLLLGISSAEDPGRPEALEERLFKGVENELDTRFHPLSRVVPQGKTATLAAAALAKEILANEARVPACLVVTADSLINGEAIEGYDSQGRLKTAENSDGVVPGEAAAALY